MNRNDGFFWLSVAPYWLRIVTAIGTIGTALPGLKRIDSVMISGSDDWSLHGPELLTGLAYIGCAALVLTTGFVLGDLFRLLLQWQAQQVTRHEIVVGARAEAAPPPLPTSQALLESLGITSPQPARIPFSSIHRNH
jgi:hypothetical protein